MTNVEGEIIELQHSSYWGTEVGNVECPNCCERVPIGGGSESPARCRCGLEWEFESRAIGRKCKTLSAKDKANSSGDEVNYKLQGKWEDLTDHDWLQIEQAANGGVSGTSDEWPDLVKAIEKVLNRKLMRQSSAWLRGFCEALVLFQ